MVGNSKAIVLVALLGCFLGEALACSMPRKGRPTIYELESASGELVLAMVEDPQPYEQFRYQPTPADQAILDRYPVNGIYRIEGPQPALVHEIGSVLERNQVLGLFEDSGDVYLVETKKAWFTIWKNGKKLRSLDEAESLSWFAAPWAYVIECGFSLHVDFDLVSKAGSYAIRIRTGEGAEFLYSATAGELLSHSKPPLPAVEEAAAEETEIAAVVAEWSELARAGELKAVSKSWSGRLADLVMTGCGYGIFETKDDLSWIDGSDRVEGLPAGADSAATGALIYAAPRLKHPLDSQVDLYRVDANLGEAMCSAHFDLSSQWMARATGAADGEEAGIRLVEQLGQPAILAVTSWPAPPPTGTYDDDELSRFGSVTAWTQTDDGWRVFAFHLFGVPVDAPTR